MSYDMEIENEQFNYTYNVSPMWYDAYPEKGIRSHYGQPGKEAVRTLQELYNHMIKNKEKLIIMNPSNGWGDYYGALTFVHDLICASLRNPDAVWKGD